MKIINTPTYKINQPTKPTNRINNIPPSPAIRGIEIWKGNKIYWDFEKLWDIISRKVKYTAGSEFLPCMFIVQ